MPFPNISPIAFEIFGLEVRWYALAYIFGFMISVSLIKHFLRTSTNNTISYKNLDDLLTYMIFGVILGGRLGYVIFYNLRYYLSNPLEIIQLWHGGMSFHGGLLGSIIATYLWSKKYKQNFLYITDLLSICAPIGLFFGRISNFINGELYGRITTSSLGIIFPNTNGLPRYPSQLFEALSEGLILFIILFGLRHIKTIRNKYGILSFTFLGGYAIARISMENFREPDEQIGFLFNSSLTMGQLLTIPMLIISIIAIIKISKQNKKEDLFITSPLLNNNTKIINRFFTRNGGVSNGVFQSSNCKYETSDDKDKVRKNREILLSSISLDANKSLFTLNQNHTNEVIIIDDPNDTPNKYLDIKADGLITTIPNIAIGILTADCIPVLLMDEEKKVIGAIHCGWQGIHKNIIKTTIDKLKSLNCDIKNIKVALGPCLKKQSYEVDIDFMENIVREKETYKNVFKKLSKKNKYLFDCTKYCVMKLKEEGINYIDILNFDTYKQDDLFFSYRRSVITKDFATSPTDEGRLLSIISIKD